MKIETIELKWFRGAADKTTFGLNGKSAVIYGSNGSGKSSFVDAFEYLIQNGKIKHLSHEFSGRKQEKGIRNTHTPVNKNSEIILNFIEEKEVNITIQEDGTSQIKSNTENLVESLQNLHKQSVILRQDELSEFICSPKGEKYSTLLPLLGLDPLENAAHNINLIISEIESESKLKELNNGYNMFENETGKIGLRIDSDNYKSSILEIAQRYIFDKEFHIDNIDQIFIERINNKIDESIAKKEPEQELLILLGQIKEIEIFRKYTGYKNDYQNAREIINSTIESQINALVQSEKYINEIDKSGKIKCPVCGTEFEKELLKDHISEELLKLNDLRNANEKLVKSKTVFISGLTSINDLCKKDLLNKWLSLESQIEVKSAIDQILYYFNEKNKNKLWEESLFNNLDTPIDIFFNKIEEENKKILPSTQQLINDKNFVTLSSQIPKYQQIKNNITTIENLLDILNSIENNIREKIQIETKSTIDQITSEIQSIWDKLHPHDSIEEIQLYIPQDSDKAIDICLKFWGKDQPSPRNTLSEGHRNSLGLCIFLALAKKSISDCDFIFLDDIVSSIDIDHRSKIADILLSKFEDKQILIFTHDRNWYTELKFQLNPRNWDFFTLRPWQSPEIGIQFFTKDQFTFEDALLTNKNNPNLAGNYIRQIMDTELSIISEKLKIQVEYLRGDKNDKRLCIEFLDRLISKGKNSFYKNNSATSQYELFMEPIADWQENKKLLLAFSNPASHGVSISPETIIQLKESCEKTLNRFKCESCTKYIFYTENGDNLQCQCGKYIWHK